MSYTNEIFYLIIPVLFTIYWIIPSKFHSCQNGLMVVVSCWIYSLWNSVFLLALFWVILSSYAGGRFLEKEGNFKPLKHLIIFITVLPFFFIKYGKASVLIPVGISYYTLQALGYLFDVSRKQIRAEKSLIDYTLFISFFSAITSGPISKADSLLPQIKTKHVFDYEKCKIGMKFFVWGLFMKVVVADHISSYVDIVYGNFQNFSGADCMLACFFYSFQIYADFAGYSMMAVGTSKVLGYDLINNFSRPYLASSITDFWRRWHISLTNWLKSYVYIAIGGNRCSRIRNYTNIIITFLVSGLFHGAYLSFIFWGLIHGIAQIIEKYVHSNYKKGWMSVSWVMLARIIAVFCFVSFAWVFFRLSTIHDAVGFIRHFSQLGTFNLHIIDLSSMATIAMGIMLIILREIKDEFMDVKLSNHITTASRWCFYLFLCSSILALGKLDSESFIYAAF